ncbi:MAG: hypothetical protein ACRDPE_05305 [Solirubrobacterales bacterium]
MILRRAALGVWDFVVGDDWRLAFAAVGALPWSLRGARPSATSASSTSS